MVFIWRTAVQKGLFGNSRFWMLVFGVMGAQKLMKRLAGNVPQTVYSEQLKPGQSLIITHLADETLG